MEREKYYESALIMLREEILFGLPFSCLHTQKKKIKILAYLLVDIPKDFAEKFKYLFISNYCTLVNK